MEMFRLSTHSMRFVGNKKILNYRNLCCIYHGIYIYICLNNSLDLYSVVCTVESLSLFYLLLYLDLYVVGDD